MQDNTYKMVVARLADEDILEALRNHEKYVDGMLLALIDEFEKRKLQLIGVDKLRAMVTKRLDDERIAAEAEAIVIEPELPLPTLFSQTTILAFTIFFSPLFGGALLAMNVAAVKKTGVWQVLSLSLALTVLVGVLNMYLIPPGSIFGLLILAAIALFMSELLWNRFIGKKVSYKNRSFTVPLIIALAISIPLIYYFYQHPELLELTTNTK